MRKGTRPQRLAACLVACTLTFLYTDAEDVRAARLTTAVWVLWSVLAFQFEPRSTQVILDPNVRCQ